MDTCFVDQPMPVIESGRPVLNWVVAPHDPAVALCGKKPAYWYGQGKEQWVTCPGCRRRLADLEIKKIAEEVAK